MTEYSEHLSVIMTKNGRRSYFFKAPLVEGYTLAKEPYREFRKGVEITTYQDDSLTTVDAVLTANYAIYYENRELWEAKGDVVVVKSDGKTLYTQQLFWNAKTKRIYSNVDTKIVQNDSRNVFQGEGFESDEEFKEWRFRRFTGKMDVDVSQMEEDEADSLAMASSNGEPLQREESAAAKSSGNGRKASTVTPAAVEKRSSDRVASAVENAVSAPESAARSAQPAPSVPSVQPVRSERRDDGRAVSDTAMPQGQNFSADTVGNAPVGAVSPVKNAGQRRATVPDSETVPAEAPHDE